MDDVDPAVLAALLGGLGWLAGAGMRRVLARIPHGVWCGRYWCEVAVAALWAAAAALHACGVLPGDWLPAALLLAAFAVPLAIADLRAGRLPDALTLPCYPVLAATAVFAEPAAWPRILVAATLLGGSHWVARVVTRGSLGGGDVKLVGALGLLLGARGWVPVLVFAPLAAAVTLAFAVGTALRAGQWQGRLPHGPGLLAAGWVLTVL